MTSSERSTVEFFDSSVFIEAVADTLGRSAQAKSVINSVKRADNRIPVVHQIVIGEVEEFLTSEDFFKKEIDIEMARKDFQTFLEGFKISNPDLENFVKEINYINNQKSRISSEFNDSIIVAIALSSEVKKVHTTDNWSLKKRDIIVNSI